MKYRGRGEESGISLYVTFLDEYYFLNERGKMDVNLAWPTRNKKIVPSVRG
jgi:hypothetical protein